jgi:hypothetical protein
MSLRDSKLYTAGNSGVLLAAARQMGAFVIDIRNEPQNVRALQESLMQGDAPAYYWDRRLSVLRPEPLRLRDSKGGMRTLVWAMRTGKPVILFCDCEAPACHRFRIAEQIAKRYGSEIVHLADSLVQAQML